MTPADHFRGTTGSPPVLAQAGIGESSEELGNRLAGKIPDYIESLQSYAASVVDNPLLAALPLAGLAVIGGVVAVTPVGLHHARHSLSGSPSDLKVGNRLEKGVDEWFSMPVWLKWADRCMHTMLIGPRARARPRRSCPGSYKTSPAGARR